MGTEEDEKIEEGIKEEANVLLLDESGRQHHACPGRRVGEFCRLAFE